MANTTWNPSDKTTNCTLTGSNLIATAGAIGTQAVRAIDRQVTGKFYWECTTNVITTTTTAVGIYSPNISLALGFNNAASIGTAGLVRSGAVLVDGVQVLTGFGTIANGNVICVAVDATARLIWFRLGAAGSWNLSAGNNPATGVGGFALSIGQGIPIYPSAVVGAVSDQITANFGDTAFTGAVPAGFTSGFTAGATMNTNALATQLAAEHWFTTNPNMQLTQVAIEEWASVAEGPLVVLDTAQARAMVLA